MHTARTIHILTNDAWLVEGISLALRESYARMAFYTAPAMEECITSLQAIRNNSTDNDIVVISIDDAALLKAVSDYVAQPELRTIVMLDIALDSNFIIYGWLCLISKKSDRAATFTADTYSGPDIRDPPGIYHPSGKAHAVLAAARP